jgi:uncharacterized damage-inducible protein DinB
MIPEFTQAVFLKSLEEWGAFAARFKALPPDRQAAYLQTQGFASIHDILAHVAVWWEEARGIIEDTLNKVERPRRKYDFDEFNAASLKRFQDTPEDKFMAWVEAERQQMIRLVSSLDAEQLKIRRVYGWLDAVTLFHLKEHGIGAPRLVVLDMLQREWVQYPDHFRGLGDAEQKAFLEKQGYTRFRDLIAHVIGWWEDILQVVDAVAKDPAYHAPAHDVDAYNASLVEMYGALDEPELWKKYETIRLALVELVINLPDEVYNQLEVQDWLKSDVIEHYFDHAV